jgi:hypothetical protein
MQNNDVSPTAEEVAAMETVLIDTALQAKNAVEQVQEKSVTSPPSAVPVKRAASAAPSRVAKRRHLRQTAVKTRPASPPKKSTNYVTPSEYKDLVRLRKKTSARLNLVSAQLQYSKSVQASLSSPVVAWDDLNEFLLGLKNASVEDLRKKQRKLERKLDNVDNYLGNADLSD